MKKALECLERIDKEYATIEYEDYNTCYKTINKALIKAQEQEKALDEIQTIIDNWLINGQYESNYALEKIDNVLEKYNI